MRRRPTIRPRKRVFLGCEGESERSYGRLLALLLEARGTHWHLDAVPLGGGDPLTLVERSWDHVQRHGRYDRHAILLDRDRLGEDAARDQRMEAIAGKVKLQLIWQEPCHEALLLRHLEGCQSLRPTSSDEALKQLGRHWPEYEKAMPAQRLVERIGEAALLRVLAVEPELRDFLVALDPTLRR
jgi:hypothetical protein